MNVKQSKVPAFFIDNTLADESLVYIEKNAPLLKAYVLVFSHPIDDKLKQRCEAWELSYIYNRGQLKSKSGKEEAEAETAQVVKADKPETSINLSLKKEIFRAIRSGETVSYSGDLVIVGNVNDGATITSEGTMAIFGIIAGDISCNGSYLIVSTLNRGKVIFQGSVVNDMITGSELKMLYKEDNKIKIKELT